MVKMEGADEFREMLDEMARRTSEAADAINSAKGDDDEEVAIRKRLVLKDKPRDARPLIKVDTEEEAREAVKNGYPGPENLARDIEDYITDQI